MYYLNANYAKDSAAYENERDLSDFVQRICIAPIYLDFLSSDKSSPGAGASLGQLNRGLYVLQLAFGGQIHYAKWIKQ